MDAQLMRDFDDLQEAKLKYGLANPDVSEKKKSKNPDGCGAGTGALVQPRRFACNELWDFISFLIYTPLFFEMGGTKTY